MGEGAGGPRSGRGRGGGRGEVRRPEGRGDAAATADAAAILIERSGCARLFPPERRSRRETPRALIPPPPALSSPPALPPLPPHTRRSPHTPPRPARRPPFPLPSGLPALGPPPRRARPPRPARISVSGRKGNAKPARPRGESGWQLETWNFGTKGARNTCYWFKTVMVGLHLCLEPLPVKREQKSAERIFGTELPITNKRRDKLSRRSP
ncbi:uncharacterized protein [Vulpes vulpes]|uniref:Uncharacterized protein n=1 Tax=Vulpes vulpes TaxID=9627 RepID=A0ABM4Z5B6_VULVU